MVSGGSVLTSGRVIAMVILSGVCISIIGVTYKVGALFPEPVEPMQVMVVLSAVGFVFFLVRLLRRADWRQMVRGPGSRGVWIGGTFTGIGQYLAAALIHVGLQSNLPLTPVWCALSLSFVVVIVYSRMVFHERLDGAKLLALAAAAGCIVASTLNAPQDPVAEAGEGTPLAASGLLLVSGLLVGIVLCNASTQVIMKELGMRRVGDQSMMQHGRELYMVLLYAFLTVGTAGHCIMHGLSPTWTSVGLGLVASVGSIGGLILLTACVSAPAAVVFTLQGIASIVAASVISVLALGERANELWVVTMVLATAAIVLGSGMIGRRRL